MAKPAGSVLVLTGAAGGIGAAIARRWREGGGVAVGLDLAYPAADGAEAGDGLACDVTDEEQVAAALSEVERQRGRIDALCHNAGILGPNAHVTKLDRSDWERILAVHLTGGFLLAKHGVPALRRAGGGSLVFVASMVAETGSPAYPAYAAAKAGLVSLTGSLAMLLARDGVRVNAVSPGSVPGTGLQPPMSISDVAGLAAGIPLGRAATPGDVASAVCFLMGPAAAHITGVTLPVDGGERYRGFERRRR